MTKILLGERRMKRMGLFLGLCVLASAAFGQDARPSMGGFLGYTFSSQYYRLLGSPSGGLWEKQELTSTWNSVKVGGFFDDTYFEASLDLGVQAGPQHNPLRTTFWGSSNSVSEQSADSDTQILEVGLRFLGKYPFDWGNLKIFPLAGLEYALVFNSANLDSRFFSRSDLNGLFLDLGAGFDVPVGSKYYFRIEGLYGLNLTPTSSTIKNYAASNGNVYSDYGYRLNVVAAVGYNL